MTQPAGDKPAGEKVVDPKAPAGSPPKAPAAPPVKTKVEQELDALTARVGGLEKKNQDLSLENATLRATVGDAQIIGDDEELPDVVMPDSTAQEIAQNFQDNPKEAIKKVGDYIKDTVTKTNKSHQKLQQKQEVIRTETRRFVADIFDKKPHLKPYEKVISALAEANYNRTGKPLQSIADAVNEFERDTLPTLKPAEKKEAREETPAPDGAAGESAPKNGPPAPEPEEPEETESELINQRVKQQRAKIF